jgi:hypothetical protein
MIGVAPMYLQGGASSWREVDPGRYGLLRGSRAGTLVSEGIR